MGRAGSLTSNFTIGDHLLESLATRLDECFEQLVLLYQQRLYAFALRLTGEPRDAEEIAQDAFVRAYRALATYPPERIRSLALRAWLYQITLNVVRNRQRNRRLQLVPLDDGGDGGVAATLADDDRYTPDRQYERAEQSSALQSLIIDLPERYRAAVVLRHIEGFDYGELATLLDQPVGTIKSNVHRGTKLLRTALEAQRLEETA